MAAATSPLPSRLSLVGLVPEVFRRQRALATLGLIFAVLLVPAIIAIGMDPRTLDGAEVWMKPAKFLASLSLYTFTLAWMFGFVEPAARRGRVAWGVVAVVWVTAAFEMIYIALQASRAERSHFNVTDQLHITMYSLMGVGALLLVGAALGMAWLIARRPIEGLRPPMRDALVIGLVLTFVLGGGLGGYMASGTGHWVNRAAAGPGLPLFGWSTTGGDLRPPHFLGIHAQQLLPLAALFVPGRGTAARLAVWTLAAVYAAFTLSVFAQALSGQPLISAGLLQTLGVRP